MLALGSTLLWAMPATAQDQTAQPQADAQAIDPNAIIVTARRREESLQDTPVAITAVNAAMLENKAAVNIGDLTGGVPNLLITNNKNFSNSQFKTKLSKSAKSPFPK